MGASAGGRRTRRPAHCRVGHWRAALGDVERTRQPLAVADSRVDARRQTLGGMAQRKPRARLHRERPALSRRCDAHHREPTRKPLGLALAPAAFHRRQVAGGGCGDGVCAVATVEHARDDAVEPASAARPHAERRACGEAHTAFACAGAGRCSRRRAQRRHATHDSGRTSRHALRRRAGECAVERPASVRAGRQRRLASEGGRYSGRPAGRPVRLARRARRRLDGDRKDAERYGAHCRVAVQRRAALARAGVARSPQSARLRSHGAAGRSRGAGRFATGAGGQNIPRAGAGVRDERQARGHRCRRAAGRKPAHAGAARCDASGADRYRAEACGRWPAHRQWRAASGEGGRVGGGDNGACRVGGKGGEGGECCQRRKGGAADVAGCRGDRRRLRFDDARSRSARVVPQAACDDARRAARHQARRHRATNRPRLARRGPTCAGRHRSRC